MLKSTLRFPPKAVNLKSLGWFSSRKLVPYPNKFIISGRKKGGGNEGGKTRGKGQREDLGKTS